MNDSLFESTYQGMVDSDDVYAAMDRMIKCPVCSRLYVFWNKGESVACYTLTTLDERDVSPASP